MTELEVTDRARMYLSKLANGINPLDDTPVPENDIVNNVRLSRCFFFAADVLRQVVEAGGIAKSEKPEKPEKHAKPQRKEVTDIPPQKREAFEYSTTPIPVSEIARRINALIEDDAMRRITHGDITTWLIDGGFIEMITDDNGKVRRRPTAAGKEIGIFVEERFSANGMHEVVVYNEQAQRFVVDNVDAILDLHYTKHEMLGTPWTREQDALLVEQYEKNVPLKEIAITLRRTQSAVRIRLRNKGYNV